MPKNVSLKNLVKRLKEFGFSGPYSGSKHPYMSKGQLKLIIPNPHTGDISSHLLSKILRQAGISQEMWNRLI
jgi:predicted RNA binding protein YcfA (HicA-like mRNA interferase family)